MIADQCATAADRLFEYLRARHLRKDGALVGPDPGASLNLRFTRFVKSYLRVLPWRDQLYYLQGQAYWIMDNLELFRRKGSEDYKQLAETCAEVIVRRQMPEGFWEYPQAEWRGRVATVEGCFGGLGLLAAHELSPRDEFLDAAIKWYDYMIERIGFQYIDSDAAAINYFSNVGRGLVPNNSTLVLWFAAWLSSATRSERYLEHCGKMVRFLAKCQLDSGELPYVLASEQGPGRVHYLCFQYNAYQFLDLVEYRRISGDDAISPTLEGIAGFLTDGLSPDGDARHDCDAERPFMHYFTSAVSAALLTAHALGLSESKDAADLGFRRLLSAERRSGGFDYSLGDYGFLSDRRSYPRNQAMILRHLLIGAELGNAECYNESCAC